MTCCFLCAGLVWPGHVQLEGNPCTSHERLIAPPSVTARSVLLTLRHTHTRTTSTQPQEGAVAMNNATRIVVGLDPHPLPAIHRSSRRRDVLTPCKLSVL
jgi:hypothetical protein